MVERVTSGKRIARADAAFPCNYQSIIQDQSGRTVTPVTLMLLPLAPEP